ncbi:MAG: class I SAM-dependent methyltransferase [Cytophagaceae bacterium]|nr:class I SAM-dependent methyltransferase [Cytophagaceae bacterium]
MNFNMISRFKRQKQLPKDEFIDRILCSVAGMTSKQNIYLMDAAIAALPEYFDVLEIGSFAGQSAIVLDYLMKKHSKKGKIVCVDPFHYEGWYDQQNQSKEYLNSVANQAQLSRHDYLEFVEQAFRTNVLFFCKENPPLLYKMKSDDFFQKLSSHQLPELTGMKFGFCYIDGDHSKESAIGDMRNCISCSIPKAMILMDDSAPQYRYGSAVAADEMLKWKEVKLIDENPNRLFQKRH